MWHSRNVRIVGGEVEEKWPALVSFDERHGLRREHVSHVFILPQRASSAGHESNSADAVDDRLIVPVTRMNLEEFRMIFAGRPITNRFAIADTDWIGRLTANRAMVFDVDRWHSITGRSHDERVLESHFVRSWCDLAIPIWATLRPQAQMPLANHSGRVPRAAQHRGQRCPRRIDD
jgi:hypothetical protein